MSRLLVAGVERFPIGARCGFPASLGTRAAPASSTSSSPPGFLAGGRRFDGFSFLRRR
jgi:hypothetical protein